MAKCQIGHKVFNTRIQQKISIGDRKELTPEEKEARNKKRKASKASKKRNR